MRFNKIKSIIFILLLTICFSINTIACVHATDEQRPTIELKINSEQNNEKHNFEVQGMLPGDHVITTYNINISHNDDVTVKFRSSIDDSSNKLSEVLKIKVTLEETGEEVYDGLIAAMDKSFNFKIKTDESTKSDLKYIVDVYLDTSVGNEYMGIGTSVSLTWWVDEISNLDDIQTGDNANLVLWGVVMFVSVASIVILAAKRKKKEGDDADEE